MVITRLHAVQPLLYLVISLLAVALIFFTLGAPLMAAFEVILYAGAIMVLFVFVIMMLNLGTEATRQEHQWLQPGMWRGPTILGLILAAELVYALLQPGNPPVGRGTIEARQVGVALFGPYVLGVELAAMLLLAGMIGAYHVGQRHHMTAKQAENAHGTDSDGTRTLSRQRPVHVGTDWPAGAS
jgi:NADH-quinone oxidoreductase subunit J